MSESRKPELHSDIWFQDVRDPAETAIYLERFSNYGITRKELQSSRPIVGIAQTGSDLAPCNRIHLTLAERVRDGIRDAGGIPMQFPVHPLQETVRRPTAALDRNLAYLGLVEVLAGYPLDGVVLMTGCDKTTPACLMAAATVNLPAIVLSAGPMLDSYVNGKLAGTGMVTWEARRDSGRGSDHGVRSDRPRDRRHPQSGRLQHDGHGFDNEFAGRSAGHVVTRLRHDSPLHMRNVRRLAYLTGLRITEMVREGLRPSSILTREAFENAIVVNSAIGGSTNSPIHLNAIARHIGVELNIEDWDKLGHDIPLLLNMQPSGAYLSEAYHRAGGVPAVFGELIAAGKIHTGALTVTGKSVGENYRCRAQLEP